MIEFLIYTLKVNISVIILYGFYYFVLRRLTFFQANRVFLLLIILISLTLPLCKFQLEEGHYPISDVILELNETVVFYEEYTTSLLNSPNDQYFSENDLMIAFYLLGAALFLVRFILSFTKVLSIKQEDMINSSTPYSSFTFWRSIFISAAHSSNDELPLVLEHESTHKQQLHSIDLLSLEVSRINLWYNPILILLKKSIKQNHEYIADSETLKVYPDKIGYLSLILKSTESVIEAPLSNSFHFTNIKNRINMITRVKTKSRNQLLYLLLIPVLSLTMAFSPVWNTVKLTAPSNYQVSPFQYSFDEITFVWPINSTDKKIIHASFGERKHPISRKLQMHKGIDIKAPRGAEVIASAAGVIAKAEFDKNYGNYVLIRHENNFETLYAHLSKMSVEAGDKIIAKDIIGEVGNTGVSTAPHLHFEIKQNDKPVDPKVFLQ